MALTAKERLRLKNCVEQITLAEQAANFLCFSYQHKPEFKENGAYDHAEWERWDALTARFARLADILTQRVFRAIDMLEFLPASSPFTDRINRAEKRGHIQSAYVWKEIREIRNQIVHEYATTQMQTLLKDAIQHIPELFACVDRLTNYQQTIQQKLHD